MFEMCTKAKMRVRLWSITQCLKPEKLLPPASPALTQVVVAVSGTSSSAGKPSAEASGKTWTCMSTRPGSTSLPSAGST